MPTDLRPAGMRPHVFHPALFGFYTYSVPDVADFVFFNLSFPLCSVIMGLSGKAEKNTHAL